MTPEIYQKVKSIFHAALEVETERLEEFLTKKCGDDRNLRKSVEELLASSNKIENFIEKPAYQILSGSFLEKTSTSQLEGKRLGTYRILKEIGRGGMGAVYLAVRDDDLYRKQVAVKLVRRGLDTEEVLQRFRNERSILAELDHPNIAKLLDGGTTDEGLPFYVMDYIEGVSLDVYCDQHFLSIKERLKIFRKVCSAVGYAHQNLVIHRDLKPSNIWVTADGTPKLLDFGIAKVFQDGEKKDATVTKFQAMTPEYASPEQVRGERVTTASDIYSLGIILYKILTGSRPYNFQSKLPQDIAHSICEEEPTLPSKVESQKEETGEKNPKSKNQNPKSLRGDLDNIVLLALRKEPERRYQTVEQFSEDIYRHLEGLPVIARPDTFLYRTSKFIRRNRIGFGVAVGILLLLIAGAIAIVRQAQIAEGQAQIAAEERNKALREQSRAERINKFFQEMLGYANPSWYAPGHKKPRDITVVAALDEAARKIENDLNEEPQVKADILITIGDTYAAMGQLGKSERVLELALKLQREINAQDSLKVADAIYLLANTKRGLAKKKEQFELYEQANAIYRNNPEGESQYPYFLLDYAASFSSAGNHAEAVRLTKESLDILRRKKGETHTAVAIAYENLAVAYERWGDIDNAFLEIQKAVKLMPLYSGTTTLRLGNIYLLKGDLQKAEEQFLKAHADFEKGKNFVWTSNALASLARVYKEKGDYNKALDFINQAVAYDRHVYAPDHRTFLIHLAMRGALLTQTGDHKRGETIIREAINTWKKNKQSISLDPSFGEQYLGECLLIQKRFAEAEPLLLSRYRNLKETQHPASPYLRTSAEKLAELYRLWGKPEKAALFAAA